MRRTWLDHGDNKDTKSTSELLDLLINLNVIKFEKWHRYQSVSKWVFITDQSYLKLKRKMLSEAKNLRCSY